MNQSAFPNMGMPRPPQQVTQQVGGMQRNGGTSSDIQPNILNILAGRPVPSGWQETVPPKQRANIIHQMVTGLRLVKPDMTLQYAISVATGFEMQQFTIAPNQESYNQSWRQKLAEITATRQNQANMQQQQFQNQQAAQMGLSQQQMQARGIVNNQNQFQPSFGMPQSQQPGQALGVPMQQQMSQNQPLLQNGNPAEMQRAVQNSQPLQNMPRPGPPNRVQTQFTPEENLQINNLAKQMSGRLTDQDKVNLHRRLSTTLGAQQQQAMQAQGIDPITAYIRNQATTAFANERQKRLQASGQSLPPSANGAMPLQGRPISQTPLGNQQQPQPLPGTQQPDLSFGVGNLDQFVGQQQEGLRHQAAGQDVVPASNSQAAPPQMRGTPHQPPQGQFAPTRPMQPPGFPQQSQPQWNATHSQQPNVQQAAHMPMQPPATNFANMSGQTPQQQALQGQLGGLGSNRGQRTPQQQHHNMPTLNQPMDPPNQDKDEMAQRTSQPTSKQGQRNGPNGQPAMPNNPQPSSSQQGQTPGPLQGQWARLPLPIRQQLQRMPDGARKQFLIEMSRKQQQQRMKAAAEAQNSGNAQSMSHQGPQAPAAETAPTQGNQPQQVNNLQATSSGNSAGPQSGGNLFGQASTMQQQGSQQGPPNSNRPLPPRMVPLPLNESQVRFMDNQPFPPTILNKNNRLGQLPESVKTWRQLKEYVQQSAQSLPPGSLQNVLGLQSIHMQQIQASTAKAQKMQALMAQGHMQPGQTGQAPQAPSMIPPQHNQPPATGVAPMGQFSMPQPTMQEIHAARATLPENVKGISDNQLATMIFTRRQQEFLRANQQTLNPQQQQQMIQRSHQLQIQRMNAQRGQLPAGQNQRGQVQQPPRDQGQQPQPIQQQTQPPQPAKQPVGTQGKQTQQSRQANASQAAQKGGKRATNDDVVEVPDPKTQQQARPSNARPGQIPQPNATQQMTPEAFARLSNEQKAQVQLRMQEAQAAQRAKLGATAQKLTGQTPSQNSGQNMSGNPALEELINEVDRNTPQRAPVLMSPKTRSQMIEKLKGSTGNMLQRMQESLPVFLRMTKSKDQAKELLRIRLVLLRQVQDPGFTIPVDKFTMTIQELDTYKAKLHHYFTFMRRSFQPQPVGAATTAQPPPGQPQQLNAANLQQHQAMFNAARVASAQKNQANNTSRAPAAPTATHPPFSFASQSPQGVPQIYAGKNELTQERLVLPPQAKRRKPNQAVSTASTPAQTMNTPITKSSPIAKVESPEVQRAPVVPNMLKCSVLDCESGKMGFSSREDLAKHQKEVHEPKEPAIKDPLDAAAYAIESLRIALNLDEDGKAKPVELTKDSIDLSKDGKGPLQAPPMKVSASSQSQPIKQEAGTPMSRNPTQTGPSPSSNLLRTPQAAAAIKTPASDAKSATKDSGTKGSLAKTSSNTAADPWASSNVKPEWFKEVFSDVARLNRPVSDDFISNWLEKNPFTPPTSPSSGALDKASPPKSDISVNDNLDIKLVTHDEDWLPSEWVDDSLRGDMEALDVGDLMDFNWDATFGKAEEEGEVSGKGKRRRDPAEPSDEWLKVWAPEKYEENKKTDAHRKR